MDGLVIALICFCGLFVVSLLIIIIPKIRGRFKSKDKSTYAPVKETNADTKKADKASKKSDRMQRPVVLTSQNQKTDFENLKEQTKRESNTQQVTIQQPLPTSNRTTTTRPFMQSRSSNATAYDDHNYDDPQDEAAYTSSFDRFGGRRTLMNNSTDIADDLRNLSPEMKRLLVGNVLDSKTNKDVNDRR